MAQVLPQLRTRDYGAGLREALASAGEHYARTKSNQEQEEAKATLADPNATVQQKEKAVLKLGDIKDFLKFQSNQQLENSLSNYSNVIEGRSNAGVENPAKGGGNKRLNQPAQVSDEDVGGQANADFMGVQTSAPIKTSSPSAPTQVLAPKKGSEEQVSDVMRSEEDLENPEIDEEAVNAAIADIARHNPQIAGVLTKQQATRQRTKIENQKAIDKSYEITQPFRSRIAGEAEEAEQSDMLVDRILELADQQESTPAFVSLMQKLGVPTAVFGNPSEEQLDKLSGELLKNIPSGWKGKIFASEFSVLMRTVPTLLNSAEGKKLIARNMKLIFSAAPIKYEAMRELTKKYLDEGKKLPADFEERVKDMIKPKMDFLKKEFIKGSDEALSLAKRIEQGGTTRETPKFDKKTLEYLKSLKPLKQGSERFLAPEGFAIDIPEDEVETALKFHKNLRRV